MGWVVAMNLTSYFGAMFESAGAIGPKHWMGRNARNNAEKWMEELVENVRQGTVTPSENTALYRFSFYFLFFCSK